MTGEQRTAEIAGAGLAGLATATALARRGWRVRVHEKGRDLREIGAGIYLFENALDALDELGVLQQVAASGVAQTQPRRLLDHRQRYVDLRGGDTRPPPRLIVMLRTELHRILAEAAVAAGVEIVTGSRVLGADPDGRLEFAAGFGERADLVVGADGVFSRVRDSLGLLTKMVELRDGCGRHLIPRRPGDSAEQGRIESWTGGRRVGIAPVSPEFHYIFLCCPESDVEGRIQQPFNLAAWVESHPWLAEYLGRLPRHPEEHWRPFYNVTCSSWSKGRAAIIGDAAHGMAPNLGQGAGVAIANATVLARALEGADDVGRALKRWEQGERAYTDMTQHMSWLYGMVGTRWPKPLLSLRTTLLPLFARTGTFQRHMRCAVDHKPSL